MFSDLTSAVRVESTPSPSPRLWSMYQRAIFADVVSCERNVDSCKRTA